MKIGIDVSMLVYRGSGVATYTYSLVRNLLKYDKKNEYRLFYSSFRRPRSFPYLAELHKSGARVFSYRFPPRMLRFCWTRYHILPVEYLLGKVDVFHSSDFLRPPLKQGTRGITTIHDLTWKIFPEFHTQDIVEAHVRKLAKTTKYGDTIIVDSDNTKKDLVKFYPDIEETNKVYIIYPGIDGRFKPIKDKNKIKKVFERYDIKYPRRYLLYVGAIEPRKNLATAIKVFAELIKAKKYADIEFLIVGRAGWKNEAVFQLVKELGLEKKIKFLGFVQDGDLPYFYNAATVFVYLSLYEGFGLPPLEAASCGIPVLLYRNSSLAEVFPRNYLFAEQGVEPEMLKRFIDSKIEVDSSFCKNFNWKNYCRKFLQIVSHSSSTE